ncbi:Hypothetical protein A7982_11590 [Minicystis rosea]|nr:Hypothetical protein A7982_11590 [Minicystis rosea]
MKPYVVKQGDYLEKVAHALGFNADEVWNDPKNAELKKQRDPNLLHPGDILYVPDRKMQWLPLKSGTDNLYIAKVPRTTVRLVFKDLDKPHANEPYVILGMGEPEEGTTDGDGALEIKVPVHIREVQISFPKSRITYPIHIGDMDPVEEASGARKRLRHLGYMWAFSGDEADDREAVDRLAILAFQQDQGLEVTGTLDDTTRAALARVHDGEAT